MIENADTSKPLHERIAYAKERKSAHLDESWDKILDSVFKNVKESSTSGALLNWDSTANINIHRSRQDGILPSV